MPSGVGELTRASASTRARKALAVALSPRVLRRAAVAAALPWLALAAALAASGVVVVDVLAGATFATALLYIASTGLYLYLLGRPWTLRLAVRRADAVAAGGVALAYLAGATWLGADPDHFHYDEFITAYASATLPPPAQLDPFAGFPAVGQWICQFPIVFFALQWPLLAALGPSVEAVRVSVWPYLALSAVYLYALAGRYVGPRTLRLVAVAAFAFLAPNLYLAGLGVHFHSSVLFMLGCLYHYERAVQARSAAHAALAGLWLGLCFLTYTASFLALPVLVVFALLGFLFRRGPSFGGLARIVGVFAATVLPFVVYAWAWKNYFAERPGQVGGALKTAATSGDLSERPARLAELLWDALKVNAAAVVEPGRGGVTDYDFGHRALLDPFTLGLLGLGALVALWRCVRRRDDASLRPLVVVLLGFVLGMVLTQPAGAFHRLVVVFPWVGLLVAIGLEGFGEAVGRWVRPARLALPALGCALFLVVNWLALGQMLEHDGRKPSVAIANYLMARVRPGAHVTITGDPALALPRELYFRTGDRYRVTTNWFDKVLPELGDGPVVIFAPQPEDVARLRERFPSWAFVDEVDGLRLEKYLLLMPPELG